MAKSKNSKDEISKEVVDRFNELVKGHKKLLIAIGNL